MVSRLLGAHHGELATATKAFLHMALWFGGGIAIVALFVVYIAILIFS